jgi:hypothetical protein
MAVGPTNPVVPPPPAPRVPADDSPFGLDFEAHHFIRHDSAGTSLTADERVSLKFAIGSEPGVADWVSKVRAFQQKFGLRVDGDVGRQTWHQVEQLVHFTQAMADRGQALAAEDVTALNPANLRKAIDDLGTDDPVLAVPSSTVKVGWKFLRSQVEKVQAAVKKTADSFADVPPPPARSAAAPAPAAARPEDHVVSSPDVIPVATVATVAASKSVAELQSLAAAAAKRVKDGATQLRTLEGPAAEQALTDLQGDYAQWQQTVAALVKKGATTLPEVKDFARLTAQASLMHNLIRNDSSSWQAGKEFAANAKTQIQLDFVATNAGRAPSPQLDASAIEQVLANNPLLQVPELSTVSASDLTGKKTVNVTLTYEDQARTPGQPADPAHLHKSESGAVRNDVVMVFCPGVFRTFAEFTDMRAQALKDGVASVRAETGSFIDPDVSADIIKRSVDEAKALVHNPNAKVILVGHSQGNTNILAYLRKYGDAAAKDVAAIHDIDSAARGSQLADLAFAMGDYLTTDTPPTAEQQKLLNAFYVASAKQFGGGKVSVEVIKKSFENLRTVLHDVRKIVKDSKEIQHMLGLDKVHSDHELSKAILQWVVTGHVDEHASKVTTFGGKIMEILSRNQLTDGILGSGLLSKLKGSFATLQPFLGGAFNAAAQGSTPGLIDYLKGYTDDHLTKGLASLSTAYCDKLINDVKPIVRNIPMLNSVGSIPQSRATDLVPGNQKLFYDFFNQLGLDSDFEVALQNQRLEGHLSNAIDLNPNAIGHWGVTGFVGTGVQTDALFKDWDPPALTDAFLKTVQGMGII